MDKQKSKALDCIDAVSDLICGMSDAIWDVPELAFTETQSAQLQLDTLKTLGFEDIRTGLDHIPTAFSARWGSGKPVIGFIGEYDGLPGLGQEVSGFYRGEVP